MERLVGLLLFIIWMEVNRDLVGGCMGVVSLHLVHLGWIDYL